MTTFASRPPLQLLSNTHYVMSEAHSGKQRISARLKAKEDAPVPNGVGSESSRTTQLQSGKGANGTAAANGTGRKKRKIEFDEEDDGFAFTRTKAKRTKASPPTEAPADPAPEKPKPAAKRGRRKQAEADSAEPVVEKEQVPRRRSARNSGESVAPELAELHVPKKRAKAAAPRPRRKKEGPDAPREDENVDRTDVVDGTARTPVPSEPPKEPTKIALPFADTPIIRRNQEMRKGSDNSRRSSMSMRGRRASSLIESGTSNALPHSAVSSGEFYKHIESGLPEPRRMKQLLIWCAARALEDKAPKRQGKEEVAAQLAVREIQQQLLKDFSTNSELSDWFSREDVTNSEPLQPNPKNIANLAKIDELQKELDRLGLERKRWDTLLRPSPPTHSLQPFSHNSTAALSLSALPPDLLKELSPSESELFTSLAFPPSVQQPAAQPPAEIPTTDPPPNDPSTAAPTPRPDALDAAATRARISRLTRDFEFAADRLADGAHALGRHVAAADRLAATALRVCADRLAEQDRLAAERVATSAGGGEADASEPRPGMRDVLRGLSRVIER